MDSPQQRNDGTAPGGTPPGDTTPPGGAEPARPAPKRTPLTRALDTIQTLRRRLDERQGDQPVAVVGVGLRLPGGIDGLDAYWSALAEGRDLVRPMPASRKGPLARAWEGLPQRGGFLDEVLDFDADFFGISPREARHLDPQHRMLLEVSWEALENAALPVGRLTGAGFYLGIMWQDYRDWLAGEPDAYWTTGNGHNFAAGRIAHALGLNGPALAVDTACSSSLVAVHLAVQALRRGECETAFAAGVNLIMSPRSTRLVRETRSLSPDGLCRTFDARAAGFTRGEGCGAVVLKRLDHALRDGDRVHAVIRGSALNQDGRAGGFTAPNVRSQVSLTETVLAAAGLEPSDIGYVETHGTGTPLGDPIEMEALATALGRRNGGAPLPVGAVKTNLGHLESAAGIAGLIKAVLCLRERRIPPVVHFRTLNPRIDLSGTGITVPTALMDWPAGAGAHAAVSSFGMSGTNAQVVLGPPSEAETAAARPEAGPAPAVEAFEISARTPGALRDLAGAYAERLRALPEGEYAAFAHTAGAGRTRLEVRARVAAKDPAAARAALNALASGADSPAVAVTEAPVNGPDPVIGAGLPRRVAELPSYPWQRRRYAPAGAEPPADPSRHRVEWLPAAPAARAAAPGGTRLILAGDDRPLLTALARAAAARGLTGTLLTPPEPEPAMATDTGRDTGRDTGTGTGTGTETADTDTGTEAAGPGTETETADPDLGADRPESAVPDGWETGPLPGDAERWRAFWAEWDGGPARIVLAPRPTAPPTADGGPGGWGAEPCAAVTGTVAAAAAPGASVYVVTRAARRTGPEDTVTATDHAALHGLAPVLGLELSPAWGGIVDLPEEPTARDLTALLDFAEAPSRPADAPGRAPAREDSAAVRDGRVLLPRLRPAPAPPAAEGPPVRADATYLVTGGLGAVGRELAADLVERGARHLLLIGRREEDELGPEALAFLSALRRRADRVVYRGGGCDTQAALAAACAPLEELPPVRGVIHTAGTVAYGPAAGAGVAEFADALRNKAAGAWWLHRASAAWELDFYVLTSSVSAVWGTDRCAAYAAANGSLDGLAAHRRSLGLPALSIAYGPWALDGRGMADDAARERYARLGVGELDARAGRAAAAGPAPGDAGHLVVCPLDPDRFARVMAGVRPRGLLSRTDPGDRTDPEARTDLEDRTIGTDPGDRATRTGPANPAGPPDPDPGHPVPSLTSSTADVSEPSVVRALALLPERARAEAATAEVARILAGVLGHDDARAVRRDTGFFDLGLDSISAVDLAARLASAFETPLLAAEVFDHPTVTRLAARLRDRPAPAAPAAVPPRRAPGAAPDEAASDEPVSDEPVSDQRESAERDAEPVAIVGMAGRFPGADSVDELWELLRDGRDGVGAVPEGRFAPGILGGDTGEPGRVTGDQGGFLRDIDRFDADFFGIPAREAENLDPQQRMLLESAWHALEDGGIDPSGLHGTRTGVFVGISYADYARLLAQAGPDGPDAYYGTGTALNAAAGRIAYALGLNGPALAVDTACSSSLVALHLGIRSLRSGESDTVLAGGVNIILDPAASIAVSRAHMLSPGGRCRTFSADADGFVRSEGCGVLVLKRLSDARRDGDRVLALIRGSAVNQDGASSGFTAPNGTAQEAMLTAALADARTPGSEISYLEAHGTGTALGDPIEIGAAWRVLGENRPPGAPLRVGSVKSNIGHCESAAGMAAVIKTVLALRHGLIPGNLHFSEPNPGIDWASMNVQVVESATPWRATAGPRVAGVSGFGFTGTNAHVILAEEPGPAPAPEEAAAGPYLLPLSAPDPAGLDRLAEAWRRRVERADPAELPGLAAVAATGRAHFPYRRALLGHGREQLLAAPGRRAAAPRPGGAPPRIAFLFSGQGSQYAGMGRELYESEPVFRAAYDECDRLLAPALGASLTDLVLRPEDPAALDETRITQPALVALEVALAALWESWGVLPSAVMGHSVGEISAALCAKVMDLPTGLALIADRARLMQSTERGAMLALMAPEEDAARWAEEAGVDLAAVNGPRAAVVSGAAPDIGDLEKRLTGLGVRHRRLSVSHAFHSRLLEPVLDEFSAALAPLAFGPPAVPLISNVTGRLAGEGEHDAAYWREHARSPVRFLDGARRLGDPALDIDVCLEIGPDRTLVNLVGAAGAAPPGGIAFSLRRGAGARDTLLAAAAKLYERGQALDWRRISGVRRGPRPDAPRYPFADTRHWTRAAPLASMTTQAPVAPLASMTTQAPVAPLASMTPLASVTPPDPTAPPTPVPVPGLGAAPAWGTPLRSPALSGRVFATVRAADHPPHLTDHRLFGVVSVPGASQTATALSALGDGGDPVVLEDLHFPRALVLRDGERYDVQIIEARQDHGSRTVSVQSLIDADRGQWREHLAARVADPDEQPVRPAPPDPASFAGAARQRVGGARFYGHLRALGYHLGPSFRWIREVWIDGDEAIVEFAEPDGMNESPDGYAIHPGLLDSLLQSTVAFAVAAAGPGEAAEEPALAIPFAADRVAFAGRPRRGARLWGHVRAVRSDRDSADFLAVDSADLRLFDDDGATVLAVDRFRFRRAPRSLLERSLRERVRHAHELRTEPVAAPAPHPGGRRIAVAGAESPPVRTLVAALERLGHRVTAVPGHGIPRAEADLIVDVRFLAAPDGPPCPPETALNAVRTLAGSLRDTPRHLPYAVVVPAPAPDAQGPDASAPLREALWGLLASLEAEQPDRALLRLTSRAGAGPDAVAAALVDALERGFPEPRLEIDAAGPRAVRLVARDEPRPDGPPDGVAGAAALITGGLGALGLGTARILAGWGVADLTLMGRSAPDDRARAAVDALSAGGVRVRTVQGDVTEPADCRRAVAEAGRHTPLRLVLHLAGATDDRAFERLDDAALAHVFAAKAAGAHHLAEALAAAGCEPRALVLYSSASAVLGSAGQAGYAAANGFLDGLARSLRAAGTPATSIAWGPWTTEDHGGLAATDAVRRAIGRRGVEPLDDRAAADLLHLAITGRAAHLAAVAVDARRYAATGGPASALVGGADDGAARDAGPADRRSEPRGALRRTLAGLDREDAHDRLRDRVRECLAEVLGERPADDDDLGFSDLGLDSIMVIDLRTRLSHALALELPATVALDHPTVALLTAYAGGLIRAEEGTGEPTAAEPARPAAAPREPALGEPALREPAPVPYAGEAAHPPPSPAAAAEPEDLSFDELVRAVRADLAEEK
ncbi:SDR family NAD(P)-dependent oxidoreductase [Streptomyces sp. NPDC014894]|uniref:SDR family NAD(P)-dependent oxidoreductase n=1 Tax=Streptomyces sp. NPDC014894 TaxID=3364931 RepID=UPI0036FB2F16